MRVLHVIGWMASRYGGPPVAVAQSARFLASRGHDVEIVTTNADGAHVLDVPTRTPVEWAGTLTTFHALTRPTRFLTSWSMLGDLKRRVGDFDVVHINGLYRFHTIAAAMAASRAGVPYVLQAHGALDPWNRSRRQRLKDAYHMAVEDRIISRAAAILCTSHQEERGIRELGYPNPTFVVPVGVDTDGLRKAGDDSILGRAGIEASEQVVMFLGRVSRMKGVDVLVNAFVRVSSAAPDVRLVIAGPDDEGLRQTLERDVRDARLEARVSFTGPVSDAEKRSLLHRSNIVALLSPGESFGLAAAEAMAVGRPVLVTPSVALAEVVASSGAGLVVQRDAGEVGSAIASLLADRDAATRMGAAGRAVADAEFAGSVVATKMEEMYSSVITSCRSKRIDADEARDFEANTGRMRAVSVCPLCHGNLTGGDRQRRCKTCGQPYSIVGGIEVLISNPDLASHDEIDHHHGGAHKAAQAQHFDRADEEAFETHRPHGTPRLYRFFLAEKFRRAVSPIRPHLSGATALVVCGGSGMDAEYLSRAGANVITSDLSLGAAKRARERSDCYGLDLRSIVADVERLPFRDESVDLVAVHDGLHHLEDPYAGLREMARVASKWVIVTEPAAAVATRIAVRLGLALDREQAGNLVARLDLTEVARSLEAQGFVVIRAQRYAMYYPHRPGPAFRALSQTLVFAVVRRIWSVANRLLGPFGNKMVVVAERRVPATD